MISCCYRKLVVRAQIIDGKRIAADVRQEIASRIKKNGRVPGLAVVLVGKNPDSVAYVKSKKKAATEVGFMSFSEELSGDSSESDILGVIQSFNTDPNVHGILVQLPLPKHIDETRVLNAVARDKDVDGFHPENIGALGMRGREPLFAPCTPKGCIELIQRSGVKIAGKRAVVIGRSNIVGLPVALMLQNLDATVTVVHSRTPEADARRISYEADILIVACGRPQYVTGDWVKPGACVIDVGINAVPDASKKSGKRLVGDVDYESVESISDYITPVPGGVGPMTVAMLLHNTLAAFERLNPISNI